MSHWKDILWPPFRNLETSRVVDTAFVMTDWEDFHTAIEERVIQ